MISGPGAVRGMRLKASQEKTQQSGFVLYCLYSQSVHVVEGVQMPAEVRNESIVLKLEQHTKSFYKNNFSKELAYP